MTNKIRSPDAYITTVTSFDRKDIFPKHHFITRGSYGMETYG